jgi:hypothetical protein
MTSPDEARGVHRWDLDEDEDHDIDGDHDGDEDGFEHNGGDDVPLLLDDGSGCYIDVPL